MSFDTLEVCLVVQLSNNICFNKNSIHTISKHPKSDLEVCSLAIAESPVQLLVRIIGIKSHIFSTYRLDILNSLLYLWQQRLFCKRCKQTIVLHIIWSEDIFCSILRRH